MPDPFVLLTPGALDDRGDGDAVPLPSDVDKHLRTVLRLPAGAGLVVADGEGAWAPARLADGGARLAGEVTVEPEPAVAIHVLQAVPKGRKLDEVVRVLTELGVDAVTPVEAERSLVKLEGPKRDKALARWTAVARAAAEQSRRPRALRVEPPATVAGLCARDEEPTVLLVAHVGVDGGLREALRELPSGTRRVAVAVGPEGGWTADEVDAFRRAGGTAVSVGRSVLRTEHAAPALAAVVSFTLGRMD